MEVTEKYFLREPYFNGRSIEISKDDFERYKEARNVILTLREISLSYSVVALSYVELEKLFNDFALKYSVGDFDINTIRSFLDEFTELCSLRLLTLLNSCSAYLDQTSQRLRSIEHVLPKAVIDFNRKCSDQYDNNIDYRLLSCLRNYSQHHKLPITGNSFREQSKWEDKDNISESKRLDEIGVHPYVSLEQIKNAKNTKTKDRRLLEEIGYQHGDVKAIVRSFLSSIAEINHWLVKYSEGSFVQSEAIIKDSQARLQIANEAGAEHIEVAILSADDEISFSLVPDIVSELAKERRKWSGIRASWRRSVSGKIASKDDTYFGSREQLWIP